MEIEKERARIFELHEHNDITYPSVVLPSSIDAMQTFTVRLDDLWIATYPKSGTHWMREIVGLINARGVPEQIDRYLYGGSTIEMLNMRGQIFPQTREEELQNPVDMSPFMNIIETAPSPRIILTHLLVHLLPPTLTQTAKVIYVARNPKDVLNSLYNFYASSPAYIPWEKLLDMFMEGKCVFGKWLENVQPFWKIKDDKNVLFCFYEDMKKDPLKSVRRVAEFLNADLADEEIDKVVEHSSFSGMKKTFQKVTESGDNIAVGGGRYPFLQKGVIGDWKNRFTVAQNEAFDVWYSQEMENTDIKFEFE